MPTSGRVIPGDAAFGGAPTTYGYGERPPRGNYARARPDFTCEQDWSAYTPQHHELYRRLYDGQASRLRGLVCEEFVHALPRLGGCDAIPRFDRVSETLYEATRWQIVAVPGLIPEPAFFALLAARKFPVTEWIREPDEFEYVVEPDVFHDLFGHVPLLFNPVFADYMQAYGVGGLKADRLGACEMLARLYWHTVEFGLVRTAAGLRAYGAGLLSSRGELRHSVLDPRPSRIAFDLQRVMRTRYRIDAFQPAYFVIETFRQLFDATRPDFTPLYEALQTATDVEAGVVLETDRLIASG